MDKIIIEYDDSRITDKDVEDFIDFANECISKEKDK